MHRYRNISGRINQNMSIATRTMREQNLSRTSAQTRYIVSPFSQCAKKSTSAKTSAFKTWPTQMVESRGDYREEAYLEDLIGGELYKYQKELPKLPIPEVMNTISTLLPTALPLAKSEEESRSFLEKCKSLPTEAENLHRRLIERKEIDMKDSSWLQNWWCTAGYLQIRDPVVVNVSYFFHFSDDGSLGVLANQKSFDSQGKSLGVMRGASILHSAAEFRKQICSGSFPQQRIGRKEPKTPLCSVAFKYMFNACRIPRKSQDTYRIYDPSLHKHCIVARKGSFFAVDFLDDFGDALPLQVIEERLQQCVELADKQVDAPKLGWLTSSDRDAWASARQEILRVGGSKLKKSLEKLESGALVINLDSETPVSKKQCGNIFLTGGLSSGNNRWFDKSVQIMCTENGKAGLIGEHSMMDGMPMISFADHITKNSYDDAVRKSEGGKLFSQNGGVESLFQDCIPSNSEDSKVHEMIAKAKSEFRTLITDHESDVQSFQGYGSTAIKKMGYSPDAFAQMAIQLAVYRLHGECVGTYEATQTRPYLHGRTETTRTVSPDSTAFVEKMGLESNFASSKSSREEKKALLRKAVGSHGKYISNASKGNGVDRHLFGMSMLADDKDKMPAIYSDPLFIRSKTWRVSTSHLTHPKFENWGFGEVVPDGLGVAYGVNSDACVFNITARKEHCWTERVCHLLEEALLEMEYINVGDKPPKSRL
jgi:carnitine O-acetyltransferase